MHTKETEQKVCFCKKQTEKTLQFCALGKERLVQMYTFFTTK